ncbi:flagellar hook protein FlgE [Acuticoccus sediminis]|uniref:Flagellar hook protein FlgE n=1 Tax=Acuticoccus sediminis TaxID=2184697 RepID=A0A8B2NSY2_9HYPH|nr:flagellar hook protein FlgE [Acuticoccus sediminis]RAI00222.1 flagellar hook protein FlgE [Acuticoccus sediminis]
MSLYNILRTGVSGMNAHSYRLATVADNIANANTVGYKRADAEFSSLILDSGPANYQSGAVTANIHYEVTKQGALTYTLSSTDVAVQGAGFFVVEDSKGGHYLTRAGSFVVDGQSGDLVNSAGFALMGFASIDGEEPVITLNDTAGLEKVNLDYMNMRATPSTTGTFRANLDAGAEVIDPQNAPNTISTPGSNGIDSGGNATLDVAYTVKSSIVAYDDLGREKTLDVYWTKIQDYDPLAPTDPQWEVVIYDQSKRNTAYETDFPYDIPNPPLGAAQASEAWLGKANVTFDPTNGSIMEIETIDENGNSSGAMAVDPNNPDEQAILSLALPDAEDRLELNITGTTQLAADYEPLEVYINGNAPATVQSVGISNDGRVYAVYEDGAEVEFYRLPLANVPSPDQMEPLPGNVYRITPSSGDVRIGLPNDAGNGSLVVGAVEQSNVDLASELTNMIIAQRAYTANSKSFQTGNELLEVLMNLKR